MTTLIRIARRPSAARRGPARRWVVIFAALPLLAALGMGPAGAQAAAGDAPSSLLLVEWPTTQTAEKQTEARARAALSAHLDAAGITATSVALADLKKARPDATTVALVPWNNADPAGPEALRDFTARGGHVILFAPATLALAEAIGAAPGQSATAPPKESALDNGPGRRAADPRASRPLDSLPALAADLVATASPLPSSAGAGTAAPGEGARPPANGPAIIEAVGGTAVSGRLPETPTEGSTRLLVAMAARWKPERWLEAFAKVRARTDARARLCHTRAEALARRDPPVALDAAARKSLSDLDAGLSACSLVTDAPAAKAAYPRLQALESMARTLSLRLVPSEPGEMRGVWIHTYKTTDWDAIMRRVRDAGFNAVFVRVGRGGNVIYPSAILPRDRWAQQAGGDELQRAIRSAHRFGLEFHAWRVCFHMGSAPKEYYNRMAAEDRLVRGPDGKQSFWANPGDPRNTDLEARAVAELVRKYDIDGIHLDYIRYPDEPHWDFDYGPVSRAQFEKATGNKVSKWPDDVFTGPLKRAYEDWERSNIDGLMERVYRETKQAKPSVQVSAAVWRAHRKYRTVIKQDWPLWVERHWLDFVVPMDYTTDADTFTQTMREQVGMVAGRMPMVAGIGTWLQPNAESVVDQVEIARRQGASGYVLFAYNDDRILSILDALKLGAQKSPTESVDRAPALTFGLGNALLRKDAPYAAAAGKELEVRVAAPSGTRALSAQVRLEDANGRALAVAGKVDAAHPALAASVPAPSGWFQVVVRGEQGRHGFVVHGPTLEGLTEDALAALRAQDAPPHVEGEGLRVGVYAHGIGSDNILTALSKAPGVRAFPVYHLQADHLAPAQALIVPQLLDISDLSIQAEQALRAWVQQGGKLILTHDAVGFRWHPASFLEAGRGTALATKRTMQVTLPGQQPWALEPGYRDYVRLAPASGATVLVREAGSGSAPVVVSAPLGQGNVILSGLLLGASSGDQPAPGEIQLLRALLAAPGN